MWSQNDTGKRVTKKMSHTARENAETEQFSGPGREAAWLTIAS